MEPIRDKKQIQQLAEYFLNRRQLRNYVLLILATHTALRISDLLCLSWNDVFDSVSRTIRSHITLTERKTNKVKIVAINKQATKALLLYYPHKRGDYIFSNNRKIPRAISRVQAWRIINTAVKAVGIRKKVGCHGLRKSWGYHAWTSGKVSPFVIMEIFNHSNYETTRRYLGITQDDLDRAYLCLSLTG